MDNEVLRQKRIDQQLADLPFSSRPPRNRYARQTNSNNNDLIRRRESMKKLRTNFYEGETSERYYNGPPFALNCKKYEDDYDTIEAHARFCKAKFPGQDIDESEKMHFFSKMKTDNYVNHFKTYFDKENESYDLDHDFILNNKKSNRSTKTSSNLKKIQGSFPSFCRPFNERIKEYFEKENSNRKNQPDSNNNIHNNFSKNPLDDRENKKSSFFDLEADPIDIEKKKRRKSKKVEYTPNIHVTRRVKSYYLANNLDLPDFLERIDPVPLRYDKIIHYHPDQT